MYLKKLRPEHALANIPRNPTLHGVVTRTVLLNHLILKSSLNRVLAVNHLILKSSLNRVLAVVVGVPIELAFV